MIQRKTVLLALFCLALVSFGPLPLAEFSLPVVRLIECDKCYV